MSPKDSQENFVLRTYTVAPGHLGFQRPARQYRQMNTQGTRTLSLFTVCHNIIHEHTQHTEISPYSLFLHACKQCMYRLFLLCVFCKKKMLEML